MVRLGMPVVPPAHTAEGLQVTAVEGGARRDAEAFLVAHSLAIETEDDRGKERNNGTTAIHVPALTFHRDC